MWLNCSRASTSNGAREGEVDLVGAGVDVLADAVDDLADAAAEHAGTDEVGDVAELPAQAVLVPRQADVDGARDLGRVAADLGTVAVEHLDLVRRTSSGRRTGRSSRRRSGRRCAACASRPRRRPRSAGRPGSGAARCAPPCVREPLALERRLVVVEQARAGWRRPPRAGPCACRRREVDAVGAVLDLGPAGADAHRGPPAGDQVDRRDRLGQDRRVAVADRVHERTALHPLGLAGQRGVHRHGLQAGGVVGRAGGAVEVVPDRDPVEPERLDPLPEQAAARRLSCVATRCAPRTWSSSRISSER